MILLISADQDDGAGRKKTKLQFTLCVSGVGGLGADKQQNLSIQFPFVRFQLVARNKTAHASSEVSQ